MPATRAVHRAVSSDALAHPSTYAWVYDDLGRVLSEAIDHWDGQFDRAESFVYDLASNRTRREVDTDGDSLADEVFASEFDANDRLLRELIDDDGTVGVDRTVTHAYDHTQGTGKTVWQGTDTSEATGVKQSRTTHSYDLQGRLSQVLVEEFTSGVVSSRTRLSYRYDPQGIRITALEETDAAADGTYETRRETRYLVDHDNATGYAQTFAETVVDADTGALISKTVYVVGHDELTQTRYEYDAQGAVTSETTHTFTHDGHGSVRVLLDAAAALAQVYTYAAYGQLLAIHSAAAHLVGTTADAALTSYLYTGEYFDARSGLEYLRARWYDPATGRFNRLDPFAGNLNDPLSLHKYLYTHGDPIGGIDPSGLAGLNSRHARGFRYRLHHRLS